MRLSIISPLLQGFISYHGACVYYRNTMSAVVKLFGARFNITVFEPGEWLLSVSTDYDAVLRKGAAISHVKRHHTVRVDDMAIIRVMKAVYRDTYGRGCGDNASR